MINKRILVATAAAAFAAGTFATALHAQPEPKGTSVCGGINACKGQSACKINGNSCKGINACKGQGWLETKSVLECEALGGKPLK